MNDEKSEDLANACNWKAAPGVYIGRLLSPAEVAEVTAGRDGAEYQQLQRWTFCGDVSPAVFELLRLAPMSGGSNERVSVFTSAAGYAYAAFTHQWGTFQHRFFVPLCEPKMAQCLDAITGQAPLGYSLAGEGSHAMFWGSVLKPAGLVPVRSMCETVPEGDEEAALEDYAEMLAEAREPARIPSVLDNTTVRYASVSAIPPYELLSRLMQRYAVSA